MLPSAKHLDDQNKTPLKNGKMALRKILCLIALLLTTTSCGRVAVFSDPKLEGPETGIKFYSPKPYVLVKRTGAKAQPIEISVVYLPDLENPLYAKAQPGIGSAKLDLKFENGVLTSLGQETDPKITDLISTLGGLPLQLADASFRREERDQLAEQSLRDEASGEAQDLKDISEQLAEIVQSDPNKESITALKQNELTSISRALASISNGLKNVRSSEQLEKIISSLEQQSKQLTNMLKQVFVESQQAGNDKLPEKAVELWTRIQSLNGDLSTVITKLKSSRPKPAAPPVITLYEIISTPTGTQLRRVKIN